MKEIIKKYYCDMCGKEIDTDNVSPRRPIICNEYPSMSIPVHMHNSSFDEEYQDGLAWETLDLCPDCADRACTIHAEVYRDGDKWRTRLSWRDGATDAQGRACKPIRWEQHNGTTVYKCENVDNSIVTYDAYRFAYCPLCGGRIETDELGIEESI